MKVGDILKEEIQDAPGLQYPYKIKINNRYQYPITLKLEDSIFIKNCDAFLNGFQNNKTIVRRHRSCTQKETLKQSVTPKLFLKKNTQNYSKNTKLNLFNDNLPIIKVSEQRAERKLSFSGKIMEPALSKSFNFKNKLNKMKNLDIDNNIESFSKSYKKKEIFLNIKGKKSSNQLRVVNLFNTDLKTKTNKNSKRYVAQNVFEKRVKHKIKVMNSIINKLNTPIFIFNKTEMN